MAPSTLNHLLVPIAGKDDAKRTCENLQDQTDSAAEVITVVFVIEHTEGYMDQTSPAALKEEAADVFSYVDEFFADGPEIRHELRSGTDAVEEIFAAADELDVSAIGFTPRPRTTLQQLLAGNPSYRLITESSHPVVVFSKSQQE